MQERTHDLHAKTSGTPLRLMLLLLILALPFPTGGFTQSKPTLISLERLDAMEPRQVKAEPVNYKGRKALRVADAAAPDAPDGLRLVVLKGTEFEDGVIEVEVSGEPSVTAGTGARGFVGVAFRVAPDAAKYECLYVRPTNGRADDQVRRNHSTQYISFPNFTWQRLRKEFPEKYESYVDLVPGEWTKIRVEVRGEKARLYVGDASQPVLLVDDLKLGKSRGQIALWVGPGTVAHFANLRISP
jgi:hypothetical protein